MLDVACIYPTYTYISTYAVGYYVCAYLLCVYLVLPDFSSGTDQDGT